MTILSRIIPDNPVLTKELRVRMRGARAYWLLLGYIGFIAALVLMRYWSFTREIAIEKAGGSNAAALGSELFAWIMVPQIFLVLFITPAITSGTLTIEREQQTMDMLTLTRLSRRSIVVGKLLSAVLFSALLIVSSLPLMSICFMLGSIDPGQVLSAYVEMLTASVMIGAMGIMWSSIAGTTTKAVMMTYITLFVLFVFGWAVFVMRMLPASSPAAAAAYATIGDLWFGGVFMGAHVPDGTGFAGFCLLAGVLMAAVASVRIEMFPHRKAFILRGLTLLLLAVQFLAIDMSWTNAWYRRGGGAVMIAVHPPIGALMITAAVLFLLTPVFATGVLASFEARRIGKYALWGFTPEGLKRGKLASGIPFLMVTTLLCLGLYALSFVLAGHSDAVTRSGALSLGLPGVPAPTLPHNTVIPATGDFWQGALALIVSIAGFGFLNVFFSVVFRTRWIAIVLSYVVLALIFVVPEVTMGIANAGAKHAPWYQLCAGVMYLNPVQVFLQMCEPATYWQSRNLMFGMAPLWRVTSEAWTAIGLISIIAMIPFVRRIANENEPVPYEEQVQLS